jgi:hypothetical protein
MNYKIRLRFEASWIGGGGGQQLSFLFFALFLPDNEERFQRTKRCDFVALWFSLDVLSPKEEFYKF